jgi:hypothetical protein
MTKLGWFEDEAYRVLAEEARNFLEKGTTVRLLDLVRSVDFRTASAGVVVVDQAAAVCKVKCPGQHC